MNRNYLIEGFLAGCGISGLVMILIFMPVVERNNNFATEMTELYVSALDDISKLTEVCGVECEKVALKHPKLHNEVVAKPIQ